MEDIESHPSGAGGKLMKFSSGETFLNYFVVSLPRRSYQDTHHTRLRRESLTEFFVSGHFRMKFSISIGEEAPRVITE